uniref:Uncharacterized protein n=1 Tax=Arundo donax TaxID=35708 RepID=A0A0A9HIG4_ARUDO
MSKQALRQIDNECPQFMIPCSCNTSFDK